MIYNRHPKQQLERSEYAGDEAKNFDYSSPPHTPRVVKSLVKGSFVDPKQVTPEGFHDNGSTAHNHRLTERIVIDSKIDSKFQSNMAKSRGITNDCIATRRASPSSFLSSIGVCAGVGKPPSTGEQNEEIRIEYRFDDPNCSTSNKDCDGCQGRQVYSCYGSPNHGDEKKSEEHIVQFSSEDLPLGQSRTCTTADSTNHSTLNALNSRDNAIAVGTLGGGISGGEGVKLNNDKIPNDAFMSARRLLFGQEETSTNQNLPKKEQSSFRCNSHDYILCTTTKRNYYSNQINKVSPTGMDNKDDEDDNIGSFLRWHSFSSPKSPNPGESPDRASVAASKTIYTAAYGDDEMTFENDWMHRDIQYWRQRLHYANKFYGKTHPSTADAYFNLGRAQMNLSPSNSSQNKEACYDPYGMPLPRDTASQQRHRYDLAIENLTIAHQIWERKHGSEHLSVGRALDSLALAIVKRANHDRATKGASKAAIKDDLSYARRLYEQAFAIRIHHLGVWHVDTVETFNKLAGVLLHLKHFQEASHAYHEVFLVRRAIFGNKHPSVAISAHSLANCYYKMGKVKESLRWYSTSLDVYERMGLSYRHPAVTHLLKDQSRLEEYMDAEI